MPWSELHSDVLVLILKRLSYTDFAQEKFYRTEYLGDFAKDRVLATSGDWLLMLDEEADFYVLNPFTREIIDLPSLDSNATAKFKRTGNYTFDISYLRYGEWFEGGFRVGVGSAVLWVDEVTREYFVSWTFDEHTMGGDYIAYCKTGDEQWREIPRRGGCLDMAFMDNKLYMCTFKGRIRILGFDDSGLARDIINHPYTLPFEPVCRDISRNPRSCPFVVNSMAHVKVGIRLSVSGDVLIILRVRSGERNLFVMYKMVGNEWEQVYSLEEEEALVWDLNVTLPTKGVTGIKKDSIYFCHAFKYRREVAAFVMSTQSLQPFEQPELLLGDARWFLPSFCTAEQ
ncbi:hypothetical protein EUTSA_v10015724mg [Eutrema salsugineum]|uniref:KIB1-4 beta-propeller domain-containing protein n=1 Tax=Eutrema salsugineum TaxID=72664 RepID=V4LR39_EUTSA|nr:hypothetical protein EUTSA_v10015724mg [Eutrema salsugineum]